MTVKSPDDKGPILVDVKAFAVKAIYEPKYKDRAIKRLTEATAAALTGRLTKGSKGYTLDGSLLKFGPDKAGKMLAAECQIAISTDKGGIKSMANGKAAFSIPGADKIKDGDIDDLCKEVVKSAMKSATQYMTDNPL